MKVENGMATCGICGRQFELKADDRYISRDSGKTGLFAGLSTQNEEQLYDTFDCPYCGCQNVAQKRNRMWIPEPIEQDDEEEQPTGGVTVVMADEVGPAPTAEQVAKLTEREEGPQFEDFSEDARPLKDDCDGYLTWCHRKCPGPDRCSRVEPGPGGMYVKKGSCVVGDPENEEAEDADN